MLVLTRKRQEQIRIGDDITITIVSVKGNCVRLGIEAPQEVRVVRSELLPHPLLTAGSPPPQECLASRRSEPIRDGSREPRQVGPQWQKKYA